MPVAGVAPEDPRADAKRALGWVVTIAAGVGWMLVVLRSATGACWPRTDLANVVGPLGFALPFLIAGAGWLALRLREQRGHLLWFGGVLLVLLLPHLPLLGKRHWHHGKHFRPTDRLRNTLSSLEAIHRERVGRYGTYEELIAQGLVERGELERLGGYTFTAHIHPARPEFEYVLVATPQALIPDSPELAEAVAYCIDERGEVLAGLAPLAIDPADPQPPPGVVPARGEALAALVAARPVLRNRFWREQAPLGFAPTLALVSLTLVGLTVWVLRLGPFRPRGDTLLA